HRADLPGDGVDKVYRDGAGVHGHAHVNVRQFGACRDVLTVDRPAHAAGQADLQCHIPARQLLEHFFVQLGAAGGEFDLHGAAVLGALNLVHGLLAGGLGGGTAAAAVLFHGEGSRDSRVYIVSAGNRDVV